MFLFSPNKKKNFPLDGRCKSSPVLNGRLGKLRTFFKIFTHTLIYAVI